MSNIKKIILIEISKHLEDNLFLFGYDKISLIKNMIYQDVQVD
jgi:hypothetical protein